MLEIKTLIKTEEKYWFQGNITLYFTELSSYSLDWQNFEFSVGEMWYDIALNVNTK